VDDERRGGEAELLDMWALSIAGPLEPVRLSVPDIIVVVLRVAVGMEGCRGGEGVGVTRRSCSREPLGLILPIDAPELREAESLKFRHMLVPGFVPRPWILAKRECMLPVLLTNNFRDGKTVPSFGARSSRSRQ